MPPSVPAPDRFEPTGALHLIELTCHGRGVSVGPSPSAHVDRTPESGRVEVPAERCTGSTPHGRRAPPAVAGWACRTATRSAIS